MTQPPVFGKRGSVPPPRPTRQAAVAPLTPAHAAFFASAHVELAAARPRAPTFVPRSGRAAFLAALVSGCMLAGFAVAGGGETDRTLASLRALGLPLDTARLLPASLLVGILGGARTSAVTTVAVRRALQAAGQTSHVAYLLAGAAAALALAALVAVLFGHMPAHGFAVEALSGAGSGFFYRVFAGSRPAP